MILKHISGMLCLLISYSKFTRTEIQNSWKMLMDIVFFIIEKTFFIRACRMMLALEG